jgi:GAF domain-containing protein
VELRGAAIGMLRIKPASDGHQWTEDEKTIIQATAERVALAAENARLVAESQKRASKEQVIGEASSKISSAINLDNILQTALREMGRILPGAEISIQVENE